MERTQGRRQSTINIKEWKIVLIDNSIVCQKVGEPQISRDAGLLRIVPVDVDILLQFDFWAREQLGFSSSEINKLTAWIRNNFLPI